MTEEERSMTTHPSSPRLVNRGSISVIAAISSMVLLNRKTDTFGKLFNQEFSPVKNRQNKKREMTYMII